MIYEINIFIIKLIVLLQIKRLKIIINLLGKLKQYS
jgi:hypothetical protein